MCHCWADTRDELFVMMNLIGVQLKWFQRPAGACSFGMDASWEHFDISKEKRALAISFGAVETDQYGPLRWQALRMMQSDNPDIVARGVRKYAFLTEATRGDPELFKP